MCERKLGRYGLGVVTQRFKQRKTILSLIHCQKRHLSAGTKQKKEGRNWFLRPVLSIPHVGRRNIELKPIKADACQGSPASSTAACTHWRPKTLFSLIRTRSIHQFEPSSNGAESGIFPPPPKKKCGKIVGCEREERTIYALSR